MINVIIIFSLIIGAFLIALKQISDSSNRHSHV